jgi:hypothetical protein
MHVRQSIRPLYEVEIEERKLAVQSNDVSLSCVFPRYPPYHSPVVEAVALPEPLKVRMITKAEKDTKVLQPFQRSLFQYLKSKPQFSLTHGVKFDHMEEFSDKLEWIYRIESEIKAILDRKKEGDLWLSGDYTAATDNFPLSVTNALIEGILSEIDHEPTRQWVRYEVSPHQIRYPANLGTGKQTSGQLMGSLLSFPLLCFLNDFIVRESGAEEGKYLINGDDIVALGQENFIQTWKMNAPKVGLSLSLGKNFIDQDFCTVNSQLFYRGEVLHTGKVSLTTRYGKTLSRCWAEAQFYFGDTPELRREFIRRNLIELRKCPRSMGVPVTHGGLGMLFNEQLLSSQRAVEVYLTDYLRPYKKSVPVPGNDHLRVLRVPVGFFDDEEMKRGGGNPFENKIFDQFSSLDYLSSSKESEGDLSFSEMTATVTLSKKVDERTTNQLLHLPIKRFPILQELRCRTVYLEKNKVGFFKERVLALALKILLERVQNREWDIDADREFLDIVQEFSFSEDPLFGDGLCFSMEEEEEDNQVIDSDYCNLLPDLKPRFVSPRWNLPKDLVRLVEDGGEESGLATTFP